MNIIKSNVTLLEQRTSLVLSDQEVFVSRVRRHDGYESVQVTLSVYVFDTIWISHEYTKPKGHWPRSYTVFLGTVFYSVCIMYLPKTWGYNRCLTGSWGWNEGGWGNSFWMDRRAKIILGSNHKSRRTEEILHPVVFHNCLLVYGPRVNQETQQDLQPSPD